MARPLIALLLTAALAGCAGASAAGTASPSSAAGSPVGEGASPTAAQESPSPSPPIVPFAPGAIVRTTVAGVQMRTNPGSSAEVVATLAKGTQLILVVSALNASPITAEGIDWYLADWSGNATAHLGSGAARGYVPASRDGVASLEQVPVVCANDTTPTIASILQMVPYARSVCLAGRTLALEGSVVVGFGGTIPAGTYTPAWLTEPFSFGVIQDASQALFPFWYPPDLAHPPLDAAGTHLRVTGHFADPLSSTCVIDPDTPHSPYPGTAHAICAEQFVATRIALVSP